MKSFKEIKIKTGGKIYFSTLKYYNLINYLKYFTKFELLIEDEIEYLEINLKDTTLENKKVEVYQILEEHMSLNGVFPLTWVTGASIEYGKFLMKDFNDTNIMLVSNGVFPYSDLFTIMTVFKELNLITQISIGALIMARYTIENFTQLKPEYENCTWFDSTRRIEFLDLIDVFNSNLSA